MGNVAVTYNYLFVFSITTVLLHLQGLVIAGIGDITRPAEKVSISQCSALAATGIVWSRYSLVIIPKNWSLFSVNVFVGATNTYHLVRAIL
jgi:hypothetical protein